MKTTDAGSIDAILDAGAAGLRYFEVFGPRYREWTGHDPAGGDYFALAARYDQQRGTDLESLRDMATALGEELEGRLDDQAATQATRFGAVSDFWSGSPAAENARQYLAETGTAIATHLDTLRAVHTATTAAVTRIETAVRSKADTISDEFDADTAAGKTPQQIDWFIDLATGGGDTGRSVQDRLRSELPEYYAEGSEPAAVCRTWLDQFFVADIDAKIARFTTLCAEAHASVTDAYDQLLTAVEGIETTTFVSPGGTPSADTELTATSGQPGYLAAVGSPQASTEPDSDTPPAGQNPAAAAPNAPRNPAGQDTPSSSAPTGTPAAAEVSDPETASTTGVPAGADDPPPGDPPAVDEASGPGLDGSATDEGPGTDLGAPDPGTDDPAATPPAATGTAGEWTPADITGMVTAIGGITGTIPDLITAVGGLAGNLDEIITATGDAVATIIDAADNQPAAADIPVEGGTPAPEGTEDSAAADDDGRPPGPAPVDTGEGAPDEETGETPLEADVSVEEEPAVEEPVAEEPVQTGQLQESGDAGGPTGDDGPGPQLPAPTPPLEPVSGTDPALATFYAGLRGPSPTTTGAAGPRPAPVAGTVSPPEQESSLSL